MSSIHSIAATPTKGVRRYHTRIKVVVHSHRSDSPIDLSDQIYACTMGKTIKGVGQASLTLVPQQNYFNSLAPNDYINIYFDRSDGFGWVRTFFGLIDRLEEDLVATETGPQSSYYVIASDFTKAFDATQIYMNPHVALRDDVFTNGTLGTFNPAATLMSSGLLMHGTPADIISNLIYVTVGFGNQLSIPPSYQSNGNLAQFIQENRSGRISTAFNLFSQGQQDRMGGLSGFNSLLNSQVSQVSAAQQQLASFDPTSTSTDAFNNYASSIGTDPATLQTAVASGRGNDFVSGALFNRTLNTITADPSNLGTYANSGLAIGLSAVAPGSRGIVDVINVGSFIEREAMAGYTNGIALANMQGSVGNQLKELSNEIVNELFFDLRPLSNGSSRLNIGTDWSTETDELGGNVGENGAPNGVRYVPAVVMREYPFSTIDYLDASQARMSLPISSLSATSVPSTQSFQTYGILYFGAIYSNRPNTPGRHIVSIPNINVQDRMGASVPANSVGKKHLDVAVISESEIERMKLGRSDTDVVNIQIINALQYNNNSNSFIMKDLNPLVTPIQIMRHGIRVRQQSTLYARVDGLSTTATGPQSLPTQQAAQTQAAASQPQARQAPAPVRSGAIGSPIQGRGGFGSSYGFRKFTRSTHWDYHHGVDIAPNPNGSAGIGQPITAIMDGELVLSAPDGVWDGYGCIIVLKHAGQAPGGKDLFSVYAHLGVPARFPNNTPVTSSTPGGGPRDGRAIGLDQMSRTKKASYSRSLKSDGTYAPQNSNVTKGQVIGYMGWTGMQRPSGCHLHFETTYNPGNGLWPTRADPRAAAVDGTIPVSQPEPPGFTYGTVRSLDPVIYFQQKGMNLQKSIRTGVFSPYGGSVTVPVEEDEGDTVETEEESSNMGGPGTQDQASATQAAGVPNQATQAATQAAAGQAVTTPGGVDNIHSRQVMARFLLLQDHWYQHNAEYLSGDITLRGAPEIRVGYRVDIKERNMSLYVEAVNHTWQFGNKMSTTLSVTRGQPNNPYPAYILPRMQGLSGGPQQRLNDSRLGDYFIIPDPLAIKRGRFIRKDVSNTGSYAPYQSPGTNEIDESADLNTRSETYVLANSEGAMTALASVGNPTQLANVDALTAIAAAQDLDLPLDPDLISTALASAENQTGTGIPMGTVPIDGFLTNDGARIPAVTDAAASPLPAPFTSGGNE